MFAVKLPDSMEHRIALLSQKTGHSKSYYVRKALETLLEEEEDYLLAESRLKENNKRIPFDAVKLRVDMED